MDNFTSHYQVKLDFQQGTENPARLFYSFAEILNGLSSLDLLLAKSIDSDIDAKLILNDIKKGSILADLNSVFSVTRQKLNVEIGRTDTQEFLDRSRRAVLETAKKKTIGINELEELNKKIDEAASDSNLQDSFNYFSPDPLDLAQSINQISQATDKLHDNETYSVKDDSNKSITLDRTTGKIDMESIELALTHEVLENESEALYLIKKPDFLGDTQWEFKYGARNLKAKILHNEWLDEFHSGRVVVVPGDSLKVRIRHTAKYNKHGHLISEKIEITKIIDIKHNQTI